MDVCGLSWRSSIVRACEDVRIGATDESMLCLAVIMILPSAEGPVTLYAEQADISH